jgi:hypothetical protein
MNLTEYRVERKNGKGQTLAAAVRRPTTLAQCADVLIDVILPALEQLLHNEAVAQEKILALEAEVKALKDL